MGCQFTPNMAALRQWSHTKTCLE